MSFVYYNANYRNKNTGDCVVRAISKFFNTSWLNTFMELSILAGEDGNVIQDNECWIKYLNNKGLTQIDLINEYSEFYTLDDFCYDHPKGRYIVSLDVGYVDLYTSADSGVVMSNHVVCVIDGTYYDTWKSGGEAAIQCWK